MNQADRPLTIRAHDLPIDETWMDSKMLVRHGVEITHMRLNWYIEPQPGVISGWVKELDRWGAEWGLLRHGELAYETFDCGRRFALASHFKIVDMDRYAKRTRRDAAEEEYLRIRRLPWWRRFLLPFLRREVTP